MPRKANPKSELFSANLQALVKFKGLTRNQYAQRLAWTIAKCDEIKKHWGPRISASAFHNWCVTGTLPERPQFTALLLYMLHGEALTKLPMRDIDLKKVEELQDDIQNLDWSSLASKHGFNITSRRNFVYSIRSDEEPRVPEWPGSKPLYMIGSFSIVHDEKGRSITDGRLRYVFGRRKELRRQWKSREVNESSAHIGFIYEIEVPPDDPHPEANSGYMLLKSSEENPLIGAKTFSGLWFDFSFRYGRYAGAVYAEELANDNRSSADSVTQVQADRLAEVVAKVYAESRHILR